MPGRNAFTLELIKVLSDGRPRTINELIPIAMKHLEPGFAVRSAVIQRRGYGKKRREYEGSDVRDGDYESGIRRLLTHKMHGARRFFARIERNGVSYWTLQEKVIEGAKHVDAT